MKNIQKDNFFQHSLNPWEAIDDGIMRQITGYDVNIMMVKVKFKKGAIGREHYHHHAQTSYVVSGKFKVKIGGEENILTEGDAFFIPPNEVHGAVCLEEGMLIDVFSPIREDFVELTTKNKDLV